MASRFVTNLVLLLASAFVIVASFALSHQTTAWLSLALGATAVILSFAGFAIRDRGALQRGLDLMAALSGAWLVIASRAYSPATVHWLAFAVATGLAGLSVIGLLLRELVLVRLHALPRTAR